MDRPSAKPTTLSASASVVRAFMSEFAMSDLFNPSGKAFSFFSTVHHTFMCIDYFLVDDRLLHTITSCSYNPIVVSDHGPVTMEFVFRTEIPRPPGGSMLDCSVMRTLLIFFQTKLTSL